MELKELKSKLLELLEVDAEFRYAVAGRLGVLELLKKLDAMEVSLNRLWEEVKALREGQNRLWEGQVKLWEEVKALREGQNRLWEEVKVVREGENRLWEGQVKLWEEVRVLREGQNRLWEEVKALREGENRLWEEVKALREGENRLWEEVKALREEQLKFGKELLKLRASFESFGRALGVTLEHYTASFVELMLEGMGFPEAEVGRKVLLHQGVLYEVNIFCDEPLTVGEATLYLGDVDEAKRELEKLLRRVEVAEKVTGKKVKLKVLAVGNASKQALEYLKAEAKELEVKIIYGRELLT